MYCYVTSKCRSQHVSSVCCEIKFHLLIIACAPSLSFCDYIAIHSMAKWWVMLLLLLVFCYSVLALSWTVKTCHEAFVVHVLTFHVYWFNQHYITMWCCDWCGHETCKLSQLDCCFQGPWHWKKRDDWE